jgi:hypothetical protein
MKIFKTFKNVPKGLKWGALLSLFLFVFLETFDFEKKVFCWDIQVISTLAIRLSLTFITGYLFYFLTSQLEKEKDRQNLTPFVKKRVNNILLSFHSMNNYIYEATKSVNSIPAKEQEMYEILKELETTSNLPGVVGVKGKNYTWIELFCLNKYKTEEEIKKLFWIASSIDSELINICSKIDDSDYHFWLSEVAMFGKDYKKFSTFSKYFTEIFNLYFELGKYAFKNDILEWTQDELDNKQQLERIYKKGISKVELEKLIKESESKSKK